VTRHSAPFSGLLLLLKKIVSFNDCNLLHRCRTGITVVSWSRPVSMSSVLRVKDVTRSTLNDLLLAALAGSLRHYLLAVGVPNPGDLTATLLVDLQPHDSSPMSSPSVVAQQSFGAGGSVQSAGYKTTPSYSQQQSAADNRTPSMWLSFGVGASGNANIV
jgi:hypothetical protein